MLAMPLPFHMSAQLADSVGFAVQASGRQVPSMTHQGGSGSWATSTSITSSTVNTPLAGLASWSVGYRENVITLLPQPKDEIWGRPAPSGARQSLHASAIPCPNTVAGVAAPTPRAQTRAQTIAGCRLASL